MGILKKLFGENDITKEKEKNQLTVISKKKTEVQTALPMLSVHPDIQNYLWIGDGEYKNYFPERTDMGTIKGSGISIHFSFDIEEPSLIYTNLPISSNISLAERPQYFPTYRDLSPEQKGVYWKLLGNPYNAEIDIGYVFVLYYGLERYLMTAKYEEVIDVILKLRDVHPNRSFQMYSANAVILTCLQRQRADIVQKFMDSLDKDYEYNFSPNLFLLCKYSLDIPLTAQDLMRLAKSFEFTNRNYIKNIQICFLKS